MKIIKLMSLLLAVLLMNSCEMNAEKEDEPCLGCNPINPPYSYDILLLGLQSASGIDLLKGIDIDKWWPDSVPKEEAEAGRVISDYTLDFVYPDLLMSPWETNKIWTKRSGDRPDKQYLYPEPWVQKWDDFGGYYYLFFQFGSNRAFDDKTFSPADKITIKLRCPYIFGDDKVHEIDTYWKIDYSGIPQELIDEYSNSFCYRIEFDGKEYTPFRFARRPDNNTTPTHALTTLILNR